MAHVRLANSIKFESIDGKTILESGQLQGVVLEHSCRTGRCGVCRVRVNDGDTQVQLPEQSLSQQELDDGFILTCCRHAVSDIELEAIDLGRLANIKIQTLPARIDSLKRLADDVLEVALRIPPASEFDFLPGQYVDVLGPSGLRRSYSVANSPRSDGRIYLHIRAVAGGAMSDYWFNAANENDLLRFEGPLGTFCLRDTSATNLVLLATGTGIAPAKAILEGLQAESGSRGFERIFLYWGGRHLPDLYWTPEFSDLPLTFIPVLSRELSWSGRTGYVQNAAVKDIGDFADAVVYACGSDVMIQAARASLTAVGLSSKRFYSDAFVRSGE